MNNRQYKMSSVELLVSAEEYYLYKSLGHARATEGARLFAKEAKLRVRYRETEVALSKLRRELAVVRNERTVEMVRCQGCGSCPACVGV